MAQRDLLNPVTSREEGLLTAADVCVFDADPRAQAAVHKQLTVSDYLRRVQVHLGFSAFSSERWFIFWFPSCLYDVGIKFTC